MKTFIYLISGLILIIGITVGIYFFKTYLDNTQKQITFRETKQYIVDPTQDKQIDVKASTLPQFVVKLADEKFKNLWIAHAAEKNIETSMLNEKGDAGLKINSDFDTAQKQIILTPENKNQFKPGLYKLNLKVKTYNDQDITITQNFTWGVLAMNFGRAIYQPGQTVKIGMGVLDDFGNTKCIAAGNVTFDTAKVWLTITSPSGKIQHLSTDDQTIIGSRECAPTSVTNNPDFQAQFKAEEIGKYTVHMEAENIHGKRSINDFFIVQGGLPSFDIMRTSYPTRIYPFGHYPVEITVVANQDYSGVVNDFVPENFRLSNLSGNGVALKHNNYQQIDWQVNWQKGQTYKLTYDIQFPLISPEFYLVGPLKIGNFTEGRSWQIASDAIQLAQSIITNAVSSTATAVTATMNNPLTANNMELIICATGTTGSSVTVSTPTTNSGENNWSTAFSSNSSSGVKIRAWYRLAKATDSQTFRCNFGSGNGTKSIQIFEYSGLSITTIRDTSKTHTSSTSCNPSFTSNSTTFIPGNPVVLVVASFTATNKRTVTGFTSGFTKETEFQGPSAGTFSTYDQVTSSIADYTNTITYNTTGGTCAAGIVSFNSPISVSQNGFRFFENQNSLTPASPIDNANTPITLATPHHAFRVRLLLDVDGTQTIGLGSGDFILKYATKSANLTCNQLTYNPVSTPGSQSDIAYNPQGLGSGVNISANTGLDPADAGYTTQLESYYEDDTSATGPLGGSNPGAISNDQMSLSGNPSQAGLWDFSLIDNTSDIQTNTYCLKVTNGDGTNLTAYVRYPEVTTFYNEVNIKSGTTIRGGAKIN